MHAMVRRTFVTGIAAFAASLVPFRAFAQAEAGNGGFAGAGANGGTVVVGGNSDVGCIGANGGIATSDASGGSGNNAIVGSDNLDLNGFCVPGDYVENRHGELDAFCSRGGVWVVIVNGRYLP